jgi:hypothetical protein
MALGMSTDTQRRITHPPALEGDGGVLCTAHTTSPRSPPLVGGVDDRDVRTAYKVLRMNKYIYRYSTYANRSKTTNANRSKTAKGG